MGKLYLYRDSQGYFVAVDSHGTRHSSLIPTLAASFLRDYRRQNPDTPVVDNWDLPWYTRFLSPSGFDG